MNAEELKNNIFQGQYPNKDQMIEFLAYLSDHQLKVFFSIAQENPDFLEFVSKNITDKVEAFQKNNVTLWSKILDGEKTFLGSL